MRFRVLVDLNLDDMHDVPGIPLVGCVSASRVRVQASPVVKCIAVLDTVSQDGIPASHGTPLPLFLLEAVLGIEISVKVSWWIGQERIAECSDVGKPFLERRAPDFSGLVVLATRAEIAVVTVVQATVPADERLRKILLEAPSIEPGRPSPVEVKVPEEVVENVESHNA